MSAHGRNGLLWNLPWRCWTGLFFLQLPNTYWYTNVGWDVHDFIDFFFNLLFNLLNYFLINSTFFFILFHGTQKEMFGRMSKKLYLYGKEQHGHSAKHLLLFVSGFGMTWGWVKDVRLDFCLKYPLSKICLSCTQCNLTLWCQKLSNFPRSVSLIDGSYSHSLYEPLLL